jgi:peptide/nickel transport system ATP-binding protein
MALACDPDLVVLDEPTTGLDVTTQAQIITLLADLRARLGMSMVYVTHDLTLLSQIADRVGVMYAGRMVEIAPTATLFRSPHHPYTQGLIASIPAAVDDGSKGRPLAGLLRREDLPPGCPFQPRCTHARAECKTMVQPLLDIGPDHAVACWRWNSLPPEEAAPPPPDRQAPGAAATVLSVQGLSVAYRRAAPVVRDVSLLLGAGETLALVGESGSGKSTIARAISGLIAPTAGTITLRGAPLAPLVGARSRDQRRLLQLVFQNPDASLNPRARVGRILQRPVDCFFPAESATSAKQVAQAISAVRLEPGHAGRYPDQLSGGERQRVALARALLARPDILLCDEILSALDVSVQASILDLLQRLKRDSGITMLFISHDLAVVRLVADRIAVLFRGEVMETGATPQVFAPPYHPYTHALLQAVPRPLQRPLPPASRPPGLASTGAAGCAYAARCAWKAGAICDTARPPWQETQQGLRLRCHLPLSDLTDLAERPARRSTE